MNKQSIFEAVDNADPDGIAVEALIQAEMEFMNGDVSQEDIDSIHGEDDGFTQMAYKDDDGYWRVTGSSVKYDDHDALVRAYPNIG